MDVFKPQKILITGLPGSGKSTICAHLLRRGYNAFDADETFLSFNGKKLPVGASIKWILDNLPLWDEMKVSALMKENMHRDVYVFGVAPNIFNFLSVFDKVYYLDATMETLTYRLGIPRENPFGTTVAQRRIVTMFAPVASIMAKIRGFEFVDASLEPEQIFSKICQGSERGTCNCYIPPLVAGH